METSQRLFTPSNWKWILLVWSYSVIIYFSAFFVLGALITMAIVPPETLLILVVMFVCAYASYQARGVILIECIVGSVFVHICQSLFFESFLSFPVNLIVGIVFASIGSIIGRLCKLQQIARKQLEITES
jgi:hypothetical protein